jgi:glycosyltransferase involved in cell wall biosynthesis
VRIAVVSQVNSPGGGARFLRALVPALAAHASVEQVTLFVDAAAAHRDGLHDIVATSPRCEIVGLDAAGSPIAPAGPPAASGIRSRLRERLLRITFVVRAYRWLKRHVLGRELDRIERVRLPDETVAALDAYDVVYFAWPRSIVPPEVSGVLAATFHDFNHRHGFGNFHAGDVDLLEVELGEWLRGQVQPISSTCFIARELDACYPFRTNAPEVVRLSSFALTEPSERGVEAVRARFGLPRDYVVCPVNVSPHKNLALVLEAVGRLKEAGSPVALVVTGAGTDMLFVKSPGAAEGSVVGAYLAELARLAERYDLRPGRDLWALGYVDDRAMDALISSATVVLAPSRYEAGSGPALDAWKLGTPVVSSALEPVEEQIDFLGTEAVLFDPEDADSLRRAMAAALADPEGMSAMAARSADAMARYTWTDVADGYVGVFERAIARRRPGTERPSVPSPFVSVLVAAYDAVATLGETLDSLLAQTDGDWEAVIVDDGSADGTLNLARHFEALDPRIRVLTQSNAGAAAARNAAAAIARGEWLLPLDADDYLEPDAFEVQRMFIEAHPGHDMYLWGQSLLSPDGSVRPSRVYRDGAVSEYGLRDVAFQRTHIGATLLWRASLFREMGGYRDVYSEDFDLMLRAALAGRTALRNPRRLQVYRVGEGSKTAAGAQRHRDSVLAVLAEAQERCESDPSLSPGRLAIVREARRRFLSAVAREEYRRRLRSGERAGLRALYVKALDRRPSPTDPWLWSFLPSMVAPGFVGLLVRARELAGGHASKRRPHGPD